MEGLQVRGRADQPAAGREHARHVGKQRLGPLDVLQDLLAEHRVDLAVGERQPRAVEDAEVLRLRVALGELDGAVEVQTRPAHVRIDGAERRRGVALPAPEVDHAGPGPALQSEGNERVREHLRGRVTREHRPQQGAEVASRHPAIGHGRERSVRD